MLICLFEIPSLFDEINRRFVIICHLRGDFRDQEANVENRDSHLRKILPGNDDARVRSFQNGPHPIVKERRHTVQGAVQLSSLKGAPEGNLSGGWLQ